MKPIIFSALLLLVLLAGTRLVVIHARKTSDAQSKPLSFQIDGKGDEGLLFLHGLLGSHRYWDAFVPEFRSKYQIVLPDLLGFGDSPKPYSGYTVEKHIEKIHAVISNASMSGKPLNIIGHSMGALLALNYAIAHPEKVKSLILINAPMGTSEEELRKSVEASSSKLMVAMTFNPIFGRFVCWLHEMVPSLSVPFIRWLEPELPAAIAKAATQHSWEGYHDTMKFVIKAQSFATLIAGAPDKPILIISSDDDEYSKLSALHSLPHRKDLQVRTIKGDHNVPLYHPDRVIKLIENFLKDVPSSESRPTSSKTITSFN